MTDALIRKTEAHDLVADGAALLDDRHPGWAGKIDLDLFAISSIHRCVLGQLYGGSFADGTAALDLSTHEMCAHGFDVLVGEGDRYPALQRAWVAAIEARR
jgi:hypothetical protein